MGPAPRTDARGRPDDSASTAAAAANMAMHGKVTPAEAGVAVVLTSIASALVNLPIVQRKAKPVMKELLLSSLLQIVIGIVVVVLEITL